MKTRMFPTFTVLLSLFTGFAHAQSGDVVIDPPTRRPPQVSPTPPVQGSAMPSLDDLVRSGFEIKALDKAGAGTAGQYLVMLQRGVEMKTCLLQITAQNNRLVRQSRCF
jgi:hypothetical protein